MYIRDKTDILTQGRGRDNFFFFIIVERLFAKMTTVVWTFTCYVVNYSPLINHFICGLHQNSFSPLWSTILSHTGRFIHNILFFEWQEDQKYLLAIFNVEITLTKSRHSGVWFNGDISFVVVVWKKRRESGMFSSCRSKEGGGGREYKH